MDVLSGFRFFHELPPSAQWRIMSNGDVVVAVPDKPPYILRKDGSVEEIKPVWPDVRH